MRFNIPVLVCLYVFVSGSLLYAKDFYSTNEFVTQALRVVSDKKQRNFVGANLKKNMQYLQARAPRPVSLIPQDMTQDPEERVDLPRDMELRRLDVVEDLTVQGQTTLNTLTVTGEAIFDGPVIFPHGAPGVPCHVLIVTKCAISSSNEFNSVKAAVDSILDNSATNRYVVQVGPGVFIEDTITLKPYVSIVGSGQNNTVIESSLTSQDLVIAANESTLESLALRGSTDAGKAAVVLHGGTFRLFDVRFEQNDICVKQDTLAADSALYVFNSTQASADSSFSRAFSISDAGGGIALCVIESFAWGPVTNPNLDACLHITGPNAIVFANNMIIGSLFAAMPGDGVHIENGALAYIFNAEMAGFNRAVNVANIGAPTLLQLQISTINNIEDVRISHPGTLGAITGRLTRTKMFIDPAVNMALSFVDPTDGGVVYAGQLYGGNSINTITNTTQQIQHGANLGVIDGGLITAVGGLNVQVSQGSGYLMIGMSPNDNLKYVEWITQIVALNDNADNYLFIDENGVLQVSLSSVSLLNAIFVGKARAQSGTVVYIQQIETEADHTATSLNYSLQQTLGPVYQTGSIVTVNGTQQVDVTSGNYSYGTLLFNPFGGSQIPFHEVYHTAPGVYTVTPAVTTFVDCMQYDNGTGLAPLGAGNYAKHELFIVGDGADETYLLLFGQTVFPSQGAAESGVLPVPPGSWTGNIVPIASFVVENNTNSIVSVLDERPRLGFVASSVAGVSIHGNLLGLLADDHPQYLLDNGTRAMSGDLNMGTFNIINAGQYNGVTVQAHASRHLPSGADPLTTLAPVDIGIVNSVGIQNAFARSDHIHNHGNLPGGSLHANATQVTAGFMSAADKTILDNITTSFVPVTGGTMTGPLTMANQQQVRFRELLINGAEEVRVQAPASLASTYTLTWPTTVGTASQALTTDGGGNLSWSSVQALDPNLTALAALAGTGFVTQTGPGAFAERTIIGTTNQVVVTNGDGVAGNPVLALPQDINSAATPVFGGMTLQGTLNMSSQNQIHFQDAAGGQYVGLYAPAVVPVSYSLALPVSDGTPGQVLTTDGSSNLSWSSVQALDPNLTALAALAGTGFVTQTGPGAFAERTITGTANQVVVANGDGVAGNPVLSLPQNINTGATPTFAGLTLSGLTASQVVVTDASKNLTSLAYASTNTASALVQRDVSGNFSAGTITANLMGNVTGSASNNVLKSGDTMTGNLVMANQTQVRLSELTVNGSDSVALQAPSALTTSYVLTFPLTVGVNGQVLTTDGSGSLSWSNVQPQNANLTALAALSGTGFVTQTGVATFAERTITGTANQVIVTNGDGVAGNPVLSLPQNINIGASPTFAGMTVSGLSTGVVHSNASGVLSSSLIVDGDVSASAAIARSKLAAGTANQVVINDGSGILSSEANLAVSRGGTGNGTLTSGQLLVGAGTSPVTFQAFGSTNTASTIVQRDGSGNFSAGTITANLTGNVTGSASNNVLKAGDTMTGNLVMANQTQVRLSELTVNGTDYVALQAPASLTTPYTLTLPTTVGSANQALTTDGSGVLSWSSVQAQNANLTALAALSGTGFVTQTGAGTFAERTITGTANQVIVTNGDGVVGNPVLSLPQNINIGASPTFAGMTVSGLSTGVVHSNASGVLSSSLIVDVDVSASAAIARSKLAAGSANQVVINDGTGVLSSEANLAVSRGGTGNGTLTSGQLLVGAGTSPVTFQAFGSTNTASTIVQRDGSGNFSAGTITANLTGNVTGSASNNVLKAGDIMTGNLVMANQTQVRLSELTVNGTDYVALQAPASLTTPYTLTLPTTVGSANQALTTDGSGVLSWSSVQAQNANLTALAALSGTGFVTQTGVATFAERTITGTANQVIVTNGDGVAGNPVLSLPQNINIGASPTFVGLTLSGLTASQAVVTDASKNLASLAYTSANTASTLVSRDASGNFSAGTITANLTGNVTGAASLNVLKAGDTMTGGLIITPSTGTALTVNGSSTTSAASVCNQASFAAAGSALVVNGAAVATSNPVVSIVQGNAAGASTGLSLSGSSTSASPLLTVVGGNAAVAQTITAGTNQNALQITGNGNSNAVTITAGSSTGGCLLLTGGSGAGIPLQVTSAAGTGNAAAFIGNGSSTAVTISPGANQSALTITGNGSADAVAITQPATVGAGSALIVTGGAATTSGSVVTINQGNAVGAKAGITVVGSSLSTTPSAIITGGNAATAMTITPGTNQNALTVTGNGTAHAVVLTQPATVAAGSALSLVGGAATTTSAVLSVTQGNAAGAKAGIALAGSTTATTPVMTIAGGNAATAMTITPGTNQTGLSVATSGTVPSLVLNGGTPALSIVAGGLTSVGTTTLSSLGAGVMQTNSSGVVSSTNGTNGQVLIGGGSAPVWAALTAGSGISITNGANSISIAATGGSGASSFVTDSGTATQSAGSINILGGSNITTSGAASTVTVNLVNSPSVSGSVTAGTGLVATTGGLSVNAGGATIVGTTTLSSLGAGVMQTNSSGVVSSSNGTNGQVLIGGGAAPTWAALTAGSGIAITNGANSISVASNGQLPSNYRAHVYRNAAQNINATTATIIFDTEVMDPNNNFSTVTGLYTAPVTGVYYVAATVTTRTTAQPADVTVNITKNGAAQTGYSASQRSPTTNNISFAVNTGGLISLAAGDTLGVTYTTNKNDNVQGGGTHLTVYLLFV